MDSDAYMFFTKCHRLYVQGVRHGVQERLSTTFGEEWWEKGIEHALPMEQRNNLRTETEKNPGLDRSFLLDAAHFPWIISKHHNEVFSDAFPDALRIFKEMRNLTALRNDWAHMREIPLARARQGADLMKRILASLRCEEALEVERMSYDFVTEPGDNAVEALIEDLIPQDGTFDLHIGTATPLNLWRQLQSYLVVEQSVELPDGQSGDEARVTIRINNTAPDSRDWPAVHFRSVSIRATGRRRGQQERHLGEIAPGYTHETEFSFAPRELIGIEFQLSGEVDADRLFQFTRTTGLPEEVLTPLREEFLHGLESIGVRAFVNGILDQIGEPSADMSFSEVATIRETLRPQADRIKEKHRELDRLYAEFGLTGDSTLGTRMKEIASALTEFGAQLNALDNAISHTNFGLIAEAVRNLNQVHLAVLRVEDAARATTLGE